MNNNNKIEKFDSENAVIISEENPNENRAKIYQCKDCNKEFDSRQALGGHRSHHHPSSKRKKFSDINDTSSSSSEEWVLQEMYKCKDCNEEFDTYQGLGGHTRIHSREKMVNDDPCSSSSSDKDLSSKAVFEYDLNLTPVENEKAVRGEGLKVSGFDLSGN